MELPFTLLNNSSIGPEILLCIMDWWALLKTLELLPKCPASASSLTPISLMPEITVTTALSRKQSSHLNPYHVGPCWRPFLVHINNSTSGERQTHLDGPLNGRTHLDGVHKEILRPLNPIPNRQSHHNRHPSLTAKSKRSIKPNGLDAKKDALNRFDPFRQVDWEVNWEKGSDQGHCWTVERKHSPWWKAVSLDSQFASSGQWGLRKHNKL